MTQSVYTNSFCADDSFTVKAMKNLADLLSASAARNPKQAAIGFEDRSISYEWLEQAARRLPTYCFRRDFLGDPEQGVRHPSQDLDVF
jgi:acyl-CoA synthetase (AMP-forming)/AMP-acid ligase II